MILEVRGDHVIEVLQRTRRAPHLILPNDATKKTAVHKNRDVEVHRQAVVEAARHRDEDVRGLEAGRRNLELKPRSLHREQRAGAFPQTHMRKFLIVKLYQLK